MTFRAGFYCGIDLREMLNTTESNNFSTTSHEEWWEPYSMTTPLTEYVGRTEMFPSYPGDINFTDNMTDENENDTEFPNTSQFIVIPIVICAVGLAENLLSFLAILHVKKLSDTFYHLLLNLCISDIFVLITALVMYIFHDLAYFKKQPCLPTFIFYPFLTTIFSEAFTTVSLVAYQSLAIFKPYTYHKFVSKPRVWVLIVLIWVISIPLAFAQYFYSMMISKVKTFMCVCFYYLTQPRESVIENVIIANTIIICVAIVLILYVKIFLKVRHLQKNDQEREGVNRQQLHSRAKIAATMVVLFGVLVVFWIPYAIVLTACGIRDGMSDGVDPQCATYHFITMTLLVVNSVIDPIIYGLRLPGVRKGYSRLFKRCLKKFNVPCSDKSPRQQFQGSPSTEVKMRHILLSDNVNGDVSKNDGDVNKNGDDVSENGDDVSENGDVIKSV